MRTAVICLIFLLSVVAAAQAQGTSQSQDQNQVQVQGDDALIQTFRSLTDDYEGITILRWNKSIASVIRAVPSTKMGVTIVSNGTRFIQQRSFLKTRTLYGYL